MAGYKYYQQVTVDHTQVAGGPLVNFPVLVSITAQQFKTIANGGKVASASGFDIVFSLAKKSLGPPLMDFEIEKWDGTTGELVAWVRVASLSSAVDTTFNIIFGNAGIAASQENLTGTWDATFRAVFHCANPPALNFKQSALVSGVPDAAGISGPVPTQAAAQVDGGYNFAGAGSHQTLPPIALWANFPVTFSFWCNSPTVAGGFADMLSVPNTYRIGVVESGANFQVYYVRDLIATVLFPTTGRPRGAWTFFVVTVDATGNAAIGYTGLPGGTLIAEAQAAGAVNVNTGSVAVACKDSIFFTFTGLCDEFRVSAVARSAGWLQTELNNQGSVLTFESFGPVKIFVGSGNGWLHFFDEDGNERDQGAL